MAKAGEAVDSAEPVEESWSDAKQKIIVSTPAAGYLFNLKLHAKLDGHPEDVYSVLADPAADKIFRGIKQVLSRQVLEDYGNGRRKLLVGHRALTKFLWLSVTFDTQLHVWEDSVGHTITFANARDDGFMKKFEGSWKVQPFSSRAVLGLSGSSSSSSSGSGLEEHEHAWFNPLAALLHSRTGSRGAKAGSTLVTLEQSLAPRVTPPGPMQGLVRGLCGRVLQNMMADLRQEVTRRQAAGDQIPSEVASSRKGREAGLPMASTTHAALDLFAASTPLSLTIKL